jgi:hypothetical protein
MNALCTIGSRAVQPASAKVVSMIQNRAARSVHKQEGNEIMSRRLAAAAFVAVATFAGSMSPASANGFSFTLTPRGESAEVIRDGLTLYGIARDLRNRAKTNQRGTGNGAAISQHGRGNTGLVFQRGRGNSGTITQNGNYNAFGLFQFGRRNSANAVQNGNGNVGITVQGNW